MHARKHKFAEDADLQQVAYDTPALVGADLANVLNNAAIYAVRDESPVITNAHLQVCRLCSACPVQLKCCLQKPPPTAGFIGNGASAVAACGSAVTFVGG